ncbi:MAG: tetratricopeptide repeat protein [Candidatus Thorarchaeota archaeon]
METEELLHSITTQLKYVGVEEIIEPEMVRPVAIKSQERKKLGNLEEQLRSAMESLKRDDRVPELLYKMGNVHFREGAFGNAILLYEQSLGLDSDRVDAWIQMGIAYYMGGEYSDAIKCLDTAIGIEPENSRALTYKGLAELELNLLEQGKANFDFAIKSDHTCCRAFLGVGLYYKKKGNLQGALQWMSRARSVGTPSVTLYQEMAKIFVEQHEFEKAIATLEDALTLDHEHPYVHALLGDIHVLKKSFDKAAHYYEKAVSVKFDDPKLWIKKGDIHRNMRSYQQAANSYEKAIHADPERVEAWVKNGQISLLLDEQDLALEYFNTALALEPDNPEVAHQRGLVYYSTGRLEEALDDFDSAFAHEPDNPHHLYFRAMILEKLERATEAKRTWQVAADLFRDLHDDTKAAECSARAKRL